MAKKTRRIIQHIFPVGPIRKACFGWDDDEQYKEVRLFSFFSAFIDLVKEHNKLLRRVKRLERKLGEG